jgi:hypothetical protein
MTDEDDRLFGPEHVRVYRETGGERGFQTYQRRTDREIPVVVLERR